MKKQVWLFVLSLVSTMSLASCQTPSSSSAASASSASSSPTSASSTGASESSASESSSSSAVSSSLPSSSSEVFETTPIADIRNGEVGTVYTIEGIVAAYNYTGQSTPYITGFWLADTSGAVYIYGETAAQNVVVGNDVVLSGTKAYYIPTNDVDAASALGYVGMLQLTDITLLANDQHTDHAIPEGIIQDLDVAAINQIPLTTDITGTLYRTRAWYHVYDNGSYTNYEIQDLNRVDTLLAYTQSNGKDYAWSNAWDGKAVDILFIVSLGKPSVNLWRICPVAIYGETPVTAIEEATYGAARALSGFADTYTVDTTVTVPTEDPLLAGLTRTFTSDSPLIAVSVVDSDTKVAISATAITTLTLTATAAYDGVQASAEMTLNIEGRPVFETITIAEAKALADGATATIEAIVAKVTYKGSMVKQGLFIADDTGSFFVYNGTATQANLANVSDGNKVVVTGTIAHYIKNADNATAENYLGDFELTEVTVDDLDTNVYDIPEGALLDGRIEDIATTLPAENISSLMYRVEATVTKSSGSYGSYTLYSIEDPTKGLPLYSQNNAADFAWLEPYIGQNVSIIVGIINLNLKSSNSNWRGCPIQVVSILDA